MSGFMNKPEHTNQAYVEVKNGKRWLACPYCGKKAFPLDDGAIIKNQSFICRGSCCKKVFYVNLPD